jgi:hypothetical protein
VANVAELSPTCHLLDPNALSFLTKESSCWPQAGREWV